ncbi:MAG: hypothetical protein JNK72_19150 [Myxococcales bacterium]|nr:hypothetical protein [Myxococcales bacterium]
MSARPRIALSGEASFVSSPGVGGVQFLAWTRVMKNGALEVIRVIVDADGTLGDVTRGEASRSKLKDEFATLTHETKVRVGPAPGAYVAARVLAARDAHLAAGKTLGVNETQWLSKLPASASPEPHPTATWAVDDAELRVARGIDLHGEPELRAMVPSPAAVAFIAAFVEKATAADSEVDPDDRTRGAFLSAIDAFYGDSERARLGTLLRDTALVFLATQRADRALDAVATAQVIEAVDSLRPHEVPFVMSLFYKFMLVRRELQRQRSGAGE